MSSCETAVRKDHNAQVMGISLLILLMIACSYRCEDLVRIMLNKGADPNAVNSSGNKIIITDYRVFRYIIFWSSGTL
jgi:hypothetical protein